MKTKSIADTLLYQRKLKGYSQQELSQKTNVTVRTIQRIENGQVTPQIQTVKLLAAALEIEVGDLMMLEDPSQESIKQKWLLIIHGAPLIGLMIPFLNVLIPLFIWIHKRDDHQVYNHHGRAVINFQLTATLLFVLAFVALLTVVRIGFIIFIAVIPLVALVVIINIITALKSQKCYYPAIPFLRKTSLLILLLALTFFYAQAQTQSQSQSIVRLDGSTITPDSINQHLQHLTQQAQVQGLAVVVFNQQRIEYQQIFGYSNLGSQRLLSDTTNLYGASLSKAVFAVLVMKLVEQKVIDLDTPLESYLPQKIYQYPQLTRWHDDFSDLKSDTLYHKITARMCLNHTSGFPNWRWFEPDQKLRVKFVPGTRYSYSGEGYVYLQVVIEKMLGKGLEELAQELIFEPLGMTQSSYQWQPHFENDFAYGHKASGEVYAKDTDNEPRAGSTLETTVKDFSNFLQAALQTKIIAKNSWQELFRPQIRIRSLAHFGPLSQVDTTLYDPINLSYGMGWGVIKTPYGNGCFKGGHGDGFQHYSILFPEVGKGVLIMSNSDNAESIFKEVLELTMADTFTPWRWANYIPYDK